MDDNTREEIMRLPRKGMGIRGIARKFGFGVKTVWRVIAHNGDRARLDLVPAVPQERPASKVPP